MASTFIDSRNVRKLRKNRRFGRKSTKQQSTMIVQFIGDDRVCDNERVKPIAADSYGREGPSSFAINQRGRFVTTQQHNICRMPSHQTSVRQLRLTKAPPVVHQCCARLAASRQRCLNSARSSSAWRCETIARGRGEKKMRTFDRRETDESRIFLSP